MLTLQKGQGFVAGAAAAGAGRMNALLIRHATNATMRKFSTALPKSPILNGIGPGATFVCHEAGSGVAAATIGMMKSSTTAVTSLLSAPPTTTAIASARTFSFTRNALNSLHIAMVRLVDWRDLRTRAVGMHRLVAPVPPGNLLA